MIPTAGIGQINTTNSKEAAVMYSLADVQPALMPDGTLSAVRIMHEGKEKVVYCFHPGQMADLIHAAFSDKTFAERRAGEIPDTYMPAVLSLIVNMWHNWERCNEATRSLVLHHLIQKDGRLYITTNPKGEK